ncbi:Protease 2 [Pseudoalteromonas holothuriae]|uniref:Protease 2 n=1 Tax=Pseudoalteromonas holothuriae TaxID=2963714 RepID=A0A9W4VSY3_9GAMM|nr:MULTISPECIES: S9 family peptidase [unclassified Pseudoalteromonas]CAH9053252.1 Protease 2 [Pseudoalteromonas sp. CIP111854]CAH9061529.1 Protease 2 [Pseudoalteromonas sp. CIP111951]
MKQSVVWQLALSSVILATGCQSTPSDNTPPVSKTEIATVTAPIASKIPHKTMIHGYELVDNYHWLRDDTRTSKQVITHLEKENRYTDKVLAPSEALRTQLFSEIKSKIVKDNRSVPVQEGRFFYFTETVGEQEYASIYRSLNVDGSEPELLLDVNELAKLHEFYSLGDIEVSPNTKLLAYTEDTLSRRIYTVKVKDLVTGNMLEDELTGVQGGVIWGNDNKTLYYVKKDPVSLLGTQVFRHILGTPQSQDELVYEEADNTYYTYISRSKDGEQIFIHHYSTESKGISVMSANERNAKPKRLIAREKGLEYSVAKHNDWYYILTNLNAVNFKLMKAQVVNVSNKENWETVIEHQPDVKLEDISLFDDHLVYQSRQQGQSKIIIRELSKNKEHELAFNDPAYRVSMTGNTTLSSDSVRVKYASMTTPSTTFEVDLNDYTKTTLKQDKVLGEFSSDDYQSERVFITARDGAKVPVSIVYKKSLFKKDGSNPLLQYGYGSYGHTVDPSFSVSRLSLLDRGFVYAIAHIRGSQMLGRPWYDEGKKLNKMNTFNDFVDVTKALVAQGYGDKNRIYAQGGSAGGLLMGAVINQAPELYHGVHSAVPFVDVINTMLDASLPLTTNEYDEWGNPNDKTYFDYMRSYSPYDQVSKQDYPNMLVTTGLHDSQVQYFEPAKWVAKLRELKTDDNKLLLKVDMEAGHGGASGRFKRIKDTALNYAFFIELANGRL